MKDVRINSGGDSGGGKKQKMLTPCAACKILRRRCSSQDCLFAPYFPAGEPHKFVNVHKVFGASNVNKMLQELPSHHRGDAVSSLVYEANARVRDPVYGCVGTISYLQQQVHTLQKQLAVVQAELVGLRATRNKELQYCCATQAMALLSPSNSLLHSPGQDDGRSSMFAVIMSRDGADDEMDKTSLSY